jgi:PAS domain S-box-containing protein
MKPRITPTNEQRHLGDEDFIVSKTDPKGIITYANRVFVALSGYHERNLIGVQHNIVRHPDMPRAAFQLLWDTIKEKREFIGYVKNMAADGSYYWVFAVATPDLDAAGNIVGYTSVRRKPRESACKAVGDLYRQMLQVEQQVGPREAIAASTKLLLSVLADQGVSYERFVLAL